MLTKFTLSNNKSITLFYNEIGLLAMIYENKTFNNLIKPFKNKEAEKYSLLKEGLLKSLPDHSDYILNDFGNEIYNQLNEHQINLGKKII